MKNKASKHNWIIDATLFGGLILMFCLDLTGEALHQWLGVALAGLAFYHLARHWGWAKSVTRHFFGSAASKSRLYWLVDAGLMVGFGGILLTGLMISSWLSLPLGSYAAWSSLHETLAIATLLLVVLKIALHWRWITKTSRHIFERSDVLPGRPAQPPTTLRPAQQPAAVSLSSQRRDFLRLMGVVSAAAVVALINVREPAQKAEAQSSTAGLPAPQVTRESASATAEPLATQTSSEPITAAPTASSADQPVSQPTASQADQPVSQPTVVPTAATVSSASAGSSPICIAYCRKGRSCSYPGECRDYRDTNGNGHCDNGECA